MATKLTDWKATHPGIFTDGAGKWLLFKLCVKRARMFDSYFAAHKASLNHEVCGCSGYHEIVELAPEFTPAVRTRGMEIGYGE
jgi:hypothetical protein